MGSCVSGELWGLVRPVVEWRGRRFGGCDVCRRRWGGAGTSRHVPSSSRTLSAQRFCNLGSVRVNGLEMATAERTDLADLLATLTPEQWEAAVAL